MKTPKNIVIAGLAGIMLGVVPLFVVPLLQADDKDDSKKELQQGLQGNKDAEKELLEPDLGCSVEFTETGFRIYARGAATYDFNDSEDILDAQKEALLNAKSQLAKFLRETVVSDEYVAKVADKMRRAKLVDGKESLAVTKTEAKRRVEVLQNSSKAILNGFVVISTRNDRDTKTVSYVGGVSDKTLKAAGLLQGALSGLAADQAKGTGKPGNEKGGAAEKKGIEKRKSKGDF